jgi:hypothetical protein
MPESSKRGRKFIKQLPSRLRMGCPNPLNALDECVAALRHVELGCTPPGYMIRDLQCAGTLMGFRQNSRAYLHHMAQKAVATEGDVLECGSGLSTLLLAITAARRGLHVHTFEHNPVCHRRLQGLIDRYHLRNIQLHQTPIRSYGDFDWYDCKPDLLSRRFRLVICDGPTRHLTDSGRYGLLPVMRERLDPLCKVILDDSHHSLDRRVIHRWRREHSIEVQSFGRFLQFAEITCI